jgi:hypothetical protein
VTSFPSAERFLKTIHGWLGVFILPWIVVIGLTGFYLNHWKMVDSLLNASAYDEALFDNWPNPQKQDRTDADALAARLWTDANIGPSVEVEYHGRPAWRSTSQSHTLIVDVATGHYWTKTRFTRKTYDPTGKLLHSKVYWGPLFKTLHERGWIGSSLGTWLADITACAMVLFGMSGLFLFIAPRMRRRRNRLMRLSTQRAKEN